MRAWWLFLILTLLALASVRPPAGIAFPPGRSLPRPAGAAPVIPPGREAQIVGLLGGVGFNRDLGDGYAFNDIQIRSDTILYLIATTGPLGHTVGALRVAPAGFATGEIATKSFALTLETSSSDPRVRDHLSAAAASVAARDDGTLYRAVTPGDSREPPPWYSDLTFWAAIWLWVWTVGLLARDRFRLPDLGPDVNVKLTHALPFLLQTVILAYWSLYYGEVARHLPRIAVQLAFGYVLDLLLAWTRRKRWDLGLGVVPIVLSSNLFLWFSGRDVWLYFATVTLAVGSKAFLLRRDGKHIFNPSAFATSVMGLGAIFFKQHMGYVDISHQLATPPNMAEVIFLLALLPQIRLNTAVISLAGAITMALMTRFIPSRGLPSPTWPGWLLTITLFAGDPATIPKTPFGRLFFGIFVGAGVSLTALVLNAYAGTDYFAKVLPVPPANALAPSFDRAAKHLGALGNRASAALAGPFKLVPLALWALVFVRENASVKQGGFNAPTHAENLTRFIVRRGEDPPVCADNPMFCKPFTFVSEIAACFGKERAGGVATARE
jgi:hypothetical protein